MSQSFQPLINLLLSCKHLLNSIDLLHLKSLFITNQFVPFLKLEVKRNIQCHCAFFSFLHLLHLFLKYFYASRKQSFCNRNPISKYINFILFMDLTRLHTYSWNINYLRSSLFVTFYREHICYNSSTFLNAFD